MLTDHLEPNPWKNQKEGLGDGLGWKCIKQNVWNL